MNIKEIHVGLSGVIPQGAYENLRPSFDITVEPEDGEDRDKIFTECRNYLRQLFDHEANRSKADLIEINGYGAIFANNKSNIYFYIVLFTYRPFTLQEDK